MLFAAGLRSHFEERAVLTSAVCRELEGQGEHFASRQARHLLTRWMRECVPPSWPREVVEFRDGLGGSELLEVADDLRVEVKLGS
jgi:hypothetical protein